MSTEKPGATNLTQEQRNMLKELTEKHTASMQEIARVVSQILGTDPTTVRKVTISYDFGTFDPVTKVRVPDPDGGPVFCTINDDGTCGCTQDPPGWSFPCS